MDWTTSRPGDAQVVPLEIDAPGSDLLRLRRVRRHTAYNVHQCHEGHDSRHVHVATLSSTVVLSSFERRTSSAPTAPGAPRCANFDRESSHTRLTREERLESLTCRSVYQQQEAETEGGEQA